MRIEECFPSDYVVVDVETSGLDPYRDRVLEIGVLVVRNREISLPVISWVLNPNFPGDGFEVPQKITEFNGITTEEVANGHDPLFVLPELQHCCKKKMITVHKGINFDRLFLNEEFKRFTIKKTFEKHQFLDTAALFKGWRLGMLESLRNTDFYEWANMVLETKAYGVYFNLGYCCEVLEIDTSDLGNAHRASVDVVMVHRVIERLRRILVNDG